MKSLFTILLAFVMLLTIIPFYAFAETAEPFSYPTITSTVCTSCGASMDYVSNDIDIEERELQSLTCPNSPFADPDSYHTHYYFTEYKLYMCSNCNKLGRKYVRRWTECQLSRETRILSQ